MNHTTRKSTPKIERTPAQVTRKTMGDVNLRYLYGTEMAIVRLDSILTRILERR